jgi:hypothetical protein
MKTIATVELELVTGGTGYPIGKVDSGSSSNDALLSTLNGIQSSLKDLSKNQNQGPFSGQNGLLFVTMLALSNQQRSSNVVYAGGGGGCYGGGCGPRHGFRFRVW